MPRTALTVVESPVYAAGLGDIAAAAVDNANGNSFVNDGRTALLVVNGSGGDLTVTLSAPAGPLTLNAAQTKTKVVANGKTAFFGPFRPDIYNSSGVVNVDWSTGTSVTAAVVRMANY